MIIAHIKNLIRFWPYGLISPVVMLIIMGSLLLNLGLSGQVSNFVMFLLIGLVLWNFELHLAVNCTVRSLTLTDKITLLPAKIIRRLLDGNKPTKDSSEEDKGVEKALELVTARLEKRIQTNVFKHIERAKDQILNPKKEDKAETTELKQWDVI